MSKPRVLIVNDEAAIREFFRFNLAARGFDVMESQGNELVFSHIREFSPDIVILDIMANKIDGFELCNKICNETDASVIGFNMRGGDADMIRCLEMGVDDYFNRPLGVAELMTRIYAILRGKRFSSACDFINSREWSAI